MAFSVQFQNKTETSSKFRSARVWRATRWFLTVKHVGYVIVKMLKIAGNCIRCTSKPYFVKASYLQRLLRSIHEKKFNLPDDWPGIYRIPINKLLANILRDEMCDEIALSNYIDKDTWRFYLLTYRRSLMKNPLMLYPVESKIQMLITYCDEIIEASGGVNNLADENSQLDFTELPIFNQFKKFVLENMLEGAKTSLKVEIASNMAMSSMADLRVPHMW